MDGVPRAMGYDVNDANDEKYQYCDDWLHMEHQLDVIRHDMADALPRAFRFNNRVLFFHMFFRSRLGYSIGFPRYSGSLIHNIPLAAKFLIAVIMRYKKTNTNTAIITFSMRLVL